MRRGERGAVLIETALVVGIILTMLLFSLEIGMLGFLQLTVDAASFVDAHLVSVGVAANTTPQQATSQIFSQVAPAQIVSTVAPAPSPSVPVDYGYNSTNATKQAGSASNRNGGASMMEPTLETATVAKPNILSLFGKSVGVTGESVDALWLECGIHANVSNSSAGCSPGAASTFQGNYFTNGEHTPPYMVGFDFLHRCTDAQPWTTCSSTGINFMALGTAEYLHAPAGSQSGNWGYSSPGIGGSATGATFAIAACHQRAYSAIATTLSNPNYATLWQYYAQPSVWGNLNGWAPATNGSMIWAQMYNQDGNRYPTLPNNNSKRPYNNFGYGPSFVSYWVVDWDLSADQAVGGIYSWDGTVQLGATPGGALGVGSNPTNPGQWCP